jgi:hypothetical protein
MCVFCNKAQLKTAALVLLGLTALLSLAALIWNAVTYARDFNFPWKDSGDMIQQIGIMQLTALTAIFVFSIIGIIAFLTGSSACLMLFAILAFLSSLFIAAIAILSLVMAYHARDFRSPGSMLSCTSNYDTVMSQYNVADNYLQQVDQGLCSQACPCKFTNPTTQNNYRAYYPMTYNTWTVNPTSGVSDFTNCPQAVQYSAYNNGQRNWQLGNAGSNYNSNFDMVNFHNYWSRVENKFNCTGFCKTTYTNGNGQTLGMVKYLFSDINRGIPENIGCMPHLLTWIAKFLDVFGGLALTLALLMFIAFLLAATYVCCPRDKQYEREPIPVIPVQNTRPNVIETNPNVVRAGGPGAQEMRQY